MSIHIVPSQVLSFRLAPIQRLIFAYPVKQDCFSSVVTKPLARGRTQTARFQYKLPSGLSLFSDLIVVKFKRGLTTEDLDHNLKFLLLHVDFLHNAVEVLEWTVVDLDGLANHE